MITDSALVGTILSTQSDTRVATGQGLVTRLITRGAVTGLMAELGTFLVRALPGTRLDTRAAGLTTKPGALTVDTAILTFMTTRTAGGAGVLALVGADEEALTLIGTVAVEAT